MIQEPVNPTTLVNQHSGVTPFLQVQSTKITWQSNDNEWQNEGRTWFEMTDITSITNL